jgi:arsenate reductase
MPARGPRSALTNCSATISLLRIENIVIKIYGIRNCDSCREARRWLEARDMDHEFIDIRTDGIELETVQRWQELGDWETMINQRSITWRKIPQFDRAELDAKKTCQLILTYPTVMKRPVLEFEDQVIFGFDEEAYQQLEK